jgi:hypothetical protein
MPLAWNRFIFGKQMLCRNIKNIMGLNNMPYYDMQIVFEAFETREKLLLP